MAEALGWVDGVEVEHRRGGERLDERWSADRPSDTVTSRVDRWHVRTGNFSAVARDLDGKRSKAGSVPYERPVDAPAPTLDTRVQSWELTASGRGNATKRKAGEPAPTITGGHDHNERCWTEERPAPTIVTTRRSDKGIIVGRQLPKGEGRNVGGWGWERPSTTVCGDPRVSPPGYRGKPEDYDEEGNYTGERSMDNAVRVSLEEAAILQTFPPDYPFQGSKSKQFEQVGNAVPPLLAYAVLSELLAEALA